MGLGASCACANTGFAWVVLTKVLSRVVRGERCAADGERSAGGGVVGATKERSYEEWKTQNTLDWEVN